MKDIAYRLADISMPRRGNIESILHAASFSLSSDIKDIAIPVQSRLQILVNPDFVEAHCQLDEQLFMFIMSEVYRFRICQTQKFHTRKSDCDIAIRASVHAFLCQHFPEESYTSFFCNFYPSDVFPACILRPPPNHPGLPEYPPGLHPDIIGLWHQLYYTKNLEFAQVIRIFSDIHPAYKLTGYYEPPIRIGGDYVQNRYDITQYHTFFSLLHLLTIEIDSDKQGSNFDRSLEELEGLYKISLNPPVTPNKTLEKAIFQAARGGLSGSIGKKRQTKHNIIQAWPTRDRRAFASSAAGHTPLLYRNTISQTGYDRCRVDIFFDVSGSMSEYLTFFAEAIISCSKKIDTHIWLFSIGIRSISLEELESGKIPTGWGTEIESLGRHIVDNKLRSVVVLTDGMVGGFCPEHHKWCKTKANIQVVYTPKHEKEDLQPYANGTHILEPIFHYKKNEETA